MALNRREVAATSAVSPLGIACFARHVRLAAFADCIQALALPASGSTDLTSVPMDYGPYDKAGRHGGPHDRNRRASVPGLMDDLEDVTKCAHVTFPPKRALGPRVRTRAGPYRWDLSWTESMERSCLEH